MNEATVRDWLQKQYGRVPDAYDEGNGVTSLRIQQNESLSIAAFVRQDHLVEILRKMEGGPTFGQVVTVFADPNSVYGLRIIQGKTAYTIGLDYPRLGISVFDTKDVSSRELLHDGRFEVQVTQELQANLADCYTPASSMEAALRDRFSPDSKNIQYEMTRRKPWTGFGAWVQLEP